MAIDPMGGLCQADASRMFDPGLFCLPATAAPLLVGSVLVLVVHSLCCGAVPGLVQKGCLLNTLIKQKSAADMRIASAGTGMMVQVTARFTKSIHLWWVSDSSAVPIGLLKPSGPVWQA